ncbi:hypothetical protein [Candidatus Ruminimicrobium bovinum]|uniref:hypothetical protein n=1 Tax=Candidatus Ruminimicrobium bovinum TaxID=3242779 RepID=UPI0039B8DABD
MSQKLIIGIILLILNVPFGWFGAGICVYYGKKYNKKFYYFLSAIIYGLSWVMLFTGIYLCGKDYAEIIFDNYVSKYIYPIMIICLIVFVTVYIVKKIRK